MRPVNARAISRYLVPHVWFALVEAGADPALRNNAGEAPKDLLSKEERERLLKHLIRVFLMARENQEAKFEEVLEVVNRCLAADGPVRISEKFLKKYLFVSRVIEEKKGKKSSWHSN